MMRGRELLIGVLAVLVAGALSAGPAQAELSFSSPQTLYAPDAGYPLVALDAQGRATVVSLQTSTAGGGPILVQVRRLNAFGLPGPVQTLEEVPRAGICVCPHLVVDPSGRATVVWVTIVDEEKRLAFAQVDPDGVPGPVQTLSPPEVAEVSTELAVDSTGSVAVAWEIEGLVDGVVEVAQIDPDGNAGEPHPLTKPGEGGGSPALAAGPDGAFHAAWNLGGEGGIDYTVLDEEGAPGSVQRVTPEGEKAVLPDIVVDSQGRATIAWWHGLGFYEAKAVRLDAEGNPEPVRPLSPPDRNVFNPKIAIDAQDRVTAIWESFQETVSSVRLGADGVPAPVQQLSPEGHMAGEPQLAAAPDGRVVVVWNHPVRFFAPGESCGVTHLEPEEDDVVRAALIGADGQLESVYDVSAYGEEASAVQVAIDSLGLPWITWESYDGTYFCEDTSIRIQESHGLAAEAPAGDPTTEPAPPASGPLQEAAVLRLARRGVAREGRVLIRARCKGEPGARCSGAIRLATGATPLASGRYRLAAGRARTLALKLTRAGRRSLADGWITATAGGRGLPAKKVLIRVPDAHT
jgi:hypothetical protein